MTSKFLVFDKEKIEEAIRLLKKVYFSDAIQNENIVMMADAISTLITNGDDADDWASSSGYGYCDDCQQEPDYNEGYL